MVVNFLSRIISLVLVEYTLDYPLKLPRKFQRNNFKIHIGKWTNVLFSNSKNTKSEVLESKDFGKVFLKIVTLESSKNKNENFLRPSKKRIQIFSTSYKCPKEPLKVSRSSEFNWLCTTKKFEKTQTQIVGYNIYTMCSKS